MATAVQLPTSAQVLVLGATGGVGQLVVAQLLQQGWPLRILARDVAKAQRMFGDRLSIIGGDLRQPETLAPAMAHITHLICCTGSTAFPSRRWDFVPVQSPWHSWWRYISPAQCHHQSRNSPAQVDAQGIANVIAAAPMDLQHFVLVSACGVLRQDRFPFSFLNAFGVLEAKLAAEQALIHSGLPYTVIRAGRLIDGPYTSYDLNTLFKAKTHQKLGVVLGKGDRLTGPTSRIDLAAACVACLNHPGIQGQIFECINQGDRPAQLNWPELLQTISAAV